MLKAPFHKPVYIIVRHSDYANDQYGIWCEESIFTRFEDIVQWVQDMQTEPSEIHSILEIDLAFGKSRDATKDVAKAIASNYGSEDEDPHRDLVDWLEQHHVW
jgi:hypothetical protein